MSDPRSAAYDAAADTLERLACAVEAAAAERDLSPAEVAEQAGVSTASVLALHDGRDIALRSAAALLRWLAHPVRPVLSAGEHDYDTDPDLREILAEARRAVPPGTGGAGG